MDKNAITGMVLIAAILGVFFYISTPSAEDKAKYQQQQDSIAVVRQIEIQRNIEQNALAVATAGQNIADTTNQAQKLQAQYGVFASAVEAKTEFVTLENNLMVVKLTNRGGRVYSVELKNFKDYYGNPLILFDGDDNQFGFMFANNNRTYNTDNLYFDFSNKTSQSADLTLKAGENGSMVYKYQLEDDSYMVNFTIASNNLKEILGKNQTSFELTWSALMGKQEKGRDFEINNSGIYFKYFQDEVDWIKSNKDETKEVNSKLQWIGFKDQFFSSVLIAKEPFNSSTIESLVPADKNSQIIRNNKAIISVPLKISNDNINEFSFYFGPNHYYTLRDHGKDIKLDELINLGWGILGWINRFAVIPVFNYLEKFIGNYGIIILVLTLLIKTVLFPFTYKSYVSTAKMKVLKPEIDEINEKISKDKPMERQQATMALYKKAGVNPLGGCLPMLLQFPFLIAMFNFFPASIELRQESFLWAEDLSAYDSIFSWTTDIPFLSQFYGNHISLFCLLMAAANIIYTWMNMEMTQSSQTLPGMKTMMYLMPIMFLFFFNSSSSGLSYYYFISTVITIGQTMLMRRFVDEKALMAKIHAHKKKPVVKSKFQMRLEEMAKQQQLHAKNKK